MRQVGLVDISGCNIFLAVPDLSEVGIPRLVGMKSLLIEGRRVTNMAIGISAISRRSSGINSRRLFLREHTYGSIRCWIGRDQYLGIHQIREHSLHRSLSRQGRRDSLSQPWLCALHNADPIDGEVRGRHYRRVAAYHGGRAIGPRTG